MIHFVKVRFVPYSWVVLLEETLELLHKSFGFLEDLICLPERNNDYHDWINYRHTRLLLFTVDGSEGGWLVERDPGMQSIVDRPTVFLPYAGGGPYSDWSFITLNGPSPFHIEAASLYNSLRYSFSSFLLFGANPVKGGKWK